MSRQARCSTRGVRGIAWVVAVMLCGVALAQAARTVWSAKPEVRLLDARSSRGTTLAVIPKGVQLKVLAEEGAWLKVEFTDKEGKTHSGYVFKGNISNDKVDGGDLASAFGMGGGETSGMDTSLAGKGVAEEVASMASGQHWDVTQADRRIAVSRAVTAQQLEAFQREGNVGVSAK